MSRSVSNSVTLHTTGLETLTFEKSRSSKLTELRVLVTLLSDDMVLDRLALLENDALLLVAVDAMLFLLSGRGDHSGSGHFDSVGLWPLDNDDLMEDKYFCMSSMPWSSFWKKTILGDE